MSAIQDTMQDLGALPHAPTAAGPLGWEPHLRKYTASTAVAAQPHEVFGFLIERFAPTNGTALADSVTEFAPRFRKIQFAECHGTFGSYRFGVWVEAMGGHSALTVRITYKPAASMLSRTLGQWLGPVAARWQAARMVATAAAYFGRPQAFNTGEFAGRRRITDR